MTVERRSLVFSSELREIQSVNQSFDQGILRVAYWGPNRNRTHISKQTFVDAIPSIYNCPIVCHYDRETDSIGGHDMEIAKSNGTLSLVNLTTPVGVVPESSQAFWEVVEEDDGSEHEYLCMPVLLWKRQEAYAHIKENGVTSQSMEIRVTRGHRDPDDGLYHIEAFEFTALCIIEVPPCFESASIEVFSDGSFQTKFAAMMEDFKKEFMKVTTAHADDIGAPEGAVNFSKGGCDPLDVNELMLRYGLTEQDIDFDVTGMDAEELEQRFAEIKARKDAPAATVFDDDGADGGDQADPEGSADDSEPAEGDSDPEGDPESGSDGQEPADEPAGDDDGDDDVSRRRDDYSLTGEQFASELMEQLGNITYEHPEWGQLVRYGYVDYDPAVAEVYVYDFTDWKLYGLSYSMNGDNVVIDIESKKRKKFAFVDFDMGSEQFCYKSIFDGAVAQYEKMGEELNALREFRKAAEEAELEAQKAERNEQEEQLFARFAELAGNKMFEDLKEHSDSYTMSELEEKCFSIRGRNMEIKFSADSAQNSTRIPVDSQARANEPYNGIFLKYGIRGAR